MLLVINNNTFIVNPITLHAEVSTYQHLLSGELFLLYMSFSYAYVTLMTASVV
jgi:hypothetical protein